MARHIDRLSAILVKSLSSPGYYADGNGLVLQVSPSGSKSWIFRFSKEGKRREMGLGPLHTVSLAMAREKASACRRLLDGGIDPIVDRTRWPCIHTKRIQTPTLLPIRMSISA